jgi:hypothetical protein
LVLIVLSRASITADVCAPQQADISAVSPVFAVGIAVL